MSSFAHDLAVVRHVSTRVAVMYLARLSRQGKTEELYARPHHPYTRALLSPFPNRITGASGTRILLTGEIPTRFRRRPAASFRRGVPMPQNLCRENRPQLATVATGREVACHYPLD